VKLSAFDVPAWVDTVTGTRGVGEDGDGTVALQEVADWHDVGATTLPKCARTCPSALIKLLPLITTTWPTDP
jgi:hypothetical protein